MGHVSSSMPPTTTALLVDIHKHLRRYFHDDGNKILEWLRTAHPDLEGFAPVELIATGKAEHLLAYILANMK